MKAYNSLLHLLLLHLERLSKDRFNMIDRETEMGAYVKLVRRVPNAFTDADLRLGLVGV